MRKIGFVALAVLCLMPLACTGGRQVAIVAHRGYWDCESGGCAHNSIASLKAAQDLGFWGSEFDVNMTRDGQLLVFHDGSAGGMKFIEHDAAEFAQVRLPNGEKIPTLDEYLTQFEKDRKCRLVFELKSHAGFDNKEKAVALSIRKLKEHGLYNPSRVIFISFDLDECRLFVQNCPGFTVQYLGREEERNPDYLDSLGINGIDSNYSKFYTDSTWYTRARNHGMSVNAWTVDKEEDMRRMIELGVDYITTNKPELCREVLSAMGVKEWK